MFINLLRGSEEHKRRFVDLDRRLRIRSPSWVIDAEETVHPEEFNFVTEMRERYETLCLKLTSDGWISLGSIWEGWLEHTNQQRAIPLNWLIQEDSWCIVETPFGDNLKLFTRSKDTAARYDITFNPLGFDWDRHFGYIRDNCVVFLLKDTTDTIVETKDWCYTNCTDSYMIRSIPPLYLDNIEKLDLLGRSYQVVVFTNTDDALKFRMTTTNVCRRVL